MNGKDKNKVAAAPKKRSAKAERPTELALTYALGELPSAQHRAGLAGLVLTLKYLERLGHEGIARIATLDDDGASFTFDEAGMRAIFDTVYAASIEESFSPSVRKDKRGEVVEPIRVEDRLELVAGKEKRKKFHVYPQVVPRASVVLDVDPTRDGAKGLWVKLWRDALWSVLRGVPSQRRPFEARAEKTELGDAKAVFDALSANSDATVPLQSTFYLGAMERSADDVSFCDRGRFQFLLNFWPTVASVYVPESEDRDGKSTFWGYAFCIPDVAALEAFVDEWPRAMRMRGTEAAAFRPRESVVSLDQEAGLSALWRLRERLSRSEGRRALADLVHAVEVVHAEKPANAVKIVATYRIEPDEPMIDEYARVRGAFWDHAYRRQRIENLTARRAETAGFDRLLQTLPVGRILGRSFSHDARISFDAHLRSRKEVTMTEATPRSLEDILLNVVTTYVNRRLKSRTGFDWKEAKEDEAKKGQYDEQREKVARGAFLAVRSRTGADFIDYFASTLCSVPQRLSREDFGAISRALREETDHVRTLTMLALSARS